MSRVLAIKLNDKEAQLAIQHSISYHFCFVFPSWFECLGLGLLLVVSRFYLLFICHINNGCFWFQVFHQQKQKTCTFSASLDIIGETKPSDMTTRNENYRFKCYSIARLALHRLHIARKSKWNSIQNRYKTFSAFCIRCAFPNNDPGRKGEKCVFVDARRWCAIRLPTSHHPPVPFIVIAFCFPFRSLIILDFNAQQIPFSLFKTRLSCCCLITISKMLQLLVSPSSEV